MDTFILLYTIFIGILIALAIATTAWMFRRHRRIAKSWPQFEKDIRGLRFQMARALVMQHSDPQWREEQLQRINKAEQEA